jgi:hypothetical protein
LGPVGPYPTPQEDCPFNAMVIIITFGMTGIAFGIRFRKDSSFFTVSIVMIWQIFLMWSALSAQIDETCNTLSGSVTVI